MSGVLRMSPQRDVCWEGCWLRGGPSMVGVCHLATVGTALNSLQETTLFYFSPTLKMPQRTANGMKQYRQEANMEPSESQLLLLLSESWD